jgi:hypothetical protein
MFNKKLKLEVKSLNDDLNRAIFAIEKLEKKLSDTNKRLLALEKRVFFHAELIKKLADCHQLEFRDGKYVSKRGRKKDCK